MQPLTLAEYEPSSLKGLAFWGGYETLRRVLLQRSDCDRGGRGDGRIRVPYSFRGLRGVAGVCCEVISLTAGAFRPSGTRWGLASHAPYTTPAAPPCGRFTGGLLRTAPERFVLQRTPSARRGLAQPKPRRGCPVQGGWPTLAQVSVLKGAPSKLAWAGLLTFMRPTTQEDCRPKEFPGPHCDI
jgi:hypothetical protein